MKNDQQSLKDEQKRIANVLSGNQLLSFFFTIIIITGFIRGEMLFIIIISPLLILSLWRLWENGAFRGFFNYWTCITLFGIINFIMLLQFDEFRFVVTHAPHLYFWELLILLLCIIDAVKDFYRSIRKGTERNPDGPAQKNIIPSPR